MEQRLTLFELNTNIKNAISTAIPNQVWVMAEISELKENRNGHCYIELIEKQGHEIIARARANIWSYTYRILKPYFETSTGQAFSCDIKVLVKATVEFHPTYGFSLNIKDIDPAYTIGDMLLHRREIIERLQKEGVFDMNKELDLPLVTQNIAVISSGTCLATIGNSPKAPQVHISGGQKMVPVPTPYPMHTTNQNVTNQEC